MPSPGKGGGGGDLGGWLKWEPALTHIAHQANIGNGVVGGRVQQEGDQVRKGV